MENELKRILIVDDSPDDIQFVMNSFSSGFAVLAATSGEKALQLAARRPQPDIILMDVEMPDMDGLETCRRLKRAEATRDIDVIFVTTYDTMEHMVASYAAGGSDYLIKPVQPGELRQKVELIIANRAAREAWTAALNSAQDVAMTALSNAGELGVVLRFTEKVASVGGYRELAKLIVDAATEYGLESSVRLNVTPGPVYSGSREPLRPLERQLLSKLQGEAGMVESGNRFIIDKGPVSLLVKNLPEDDEKRGRIRDHLATLLRNVEVRLGMLQLQKEMASIVTEANLTLLHIKDRQKAQKKTALRIMDDLMQDVEEAFMTYGLTEEQEQKILDIVQRGVDKSMDNFERGSELDRELFTIVDRLAPFSSL